MANAPGAAAAALLPTHLTAAVCALQADGHCLRGLSQLGGGVQDELPRL